MRYCRWGRLYLQYVRYTTLRYIAAHDVALRYFTLRRSAVYYIVVQYTALRYVTLRYSTLRCVTLPNATTAVRCITLHHITLHYITLRTVQRTTVRCVKVALHYVALHATPAAARNQAKLWHHTLLRQRWGGGGVMPSFCLVPCPFVYCIELHCIVLGHRCSPKGLHEPRAVLRAHLEKIMRYRHVEKPCTRQRRK